MLAFFFLSEHAMDLVQPDIDRYLDRWAASDDPVVAEMEQLATERGFPIVGPQVGRLLLMLARSIGLSIDYQGAMVDTPYDSVPEAYYFGVSFLDEIGYFRTSRRFWTALEMAGADQIRKRLEQHLVALNSEAPMADSSLSIWRPTVGCVSNSFRAAPDKLPVSAVARKDRHSSHSVFASMSLFAIHE